jgi:hypothetical protein
MPIESENIAGSLYLKIRPRKTWNLAFIVVFLPVWLWIVFRPGRGLHLALHGPLTAGSVFIPLLVLGYTCLILSTILWALFGFNLVTVTESQLQIANIIFGFSLRVRKFDNESVKALRYEEWSGGRSGKQNGIRFSCMGKLITFARNASQQDSNDLIDRLCGVYKFNRPEEAKPAGVVDWRQFKPIEYGDKN